MSEEIDLLKGRLNFANARIEALDVALRDYIGASQMSEKKKHRFPQSCDYIMTEATSGGYYIAYHLDYWTGQFDADRIGFGHGATMTEAIDDLNQRVRKCAITR